MLVPCGPSATIRPHEGHTATTCDFGTLRLVHDVDYCSNAFAGGKLRAILGKGVDEDEWRVCRSWTSRTPEWCSSGRALRSRGLLCVSNDGQSAACRLRWTRCPNCHQMAGTLLPVSGRSRLCASMIVSSSTRVSGRSRVRRTSLPSRSSSKGSITAAGLSGTFS